MKLSQYFLPVLKEIPAEMDDVKKKFPNHKIGIESKYGKIVYF